MSPAGPPAIAGGRPIRATPLPYGRHHLTPEDAGEVARVLSSGTLTGGAEVGRFEAALAEACGVGHAVAVGTGTAAVHLSLLALGVGPGDEVITTPLTFVATANSVLHAGARPIFADIGSDRCLDPESVSASISPATRAIIAVDYSGLPADVVGMSTAARGKPVVVDAAHSLGAGLGGRPAGSLSEVSTLSFHPVKHITTGEGGACLTDNPDLAAGIRRLRSHGMTSDARDRSGSTWRYDVLTLGHNYRLTDFQAALGRSQLARLPQVVERRSELAARYDSLLGDLPGIGLPPRPPGRTSAWHIYVIEVDEATFGWSRDTLIDALRAENIQATLHYPAVHTLSLYRELGYRTGVAPVAEALCSRLVTLPLFPTMGVQDQDDVVAALHRLAAWRR
jgi:dTDP-4-amino-4,6-dideoxygalactose transaminase